MARVLGPRGTPGVFVFAPLKGVLHCGIGARCYATGHQLDKKWLARWEHSPARKARDLSQGDKYYALAMFPYPSGNLHIGHLRVYTISDVLARYRRMSGYNVVHPMGWDAFGLPAENAAIERGIDPKTWTIGNIATMKKQMGEMFADFDWEREVVSCSPEYYKWTQKLFIMLYNSGLAYRKEARVNWDPVENTVLANEQVDDEGRSWRSGAIVEHKMLNQWFLGITKFAPDLLKDLELLNDWPEKVKTMQKHWIGQSDGATLVLKAQDAQETITTFTTRPDTLFAMQYVALALDHPLVAKYASRDSKLEEFVNQARNLPDDTKLGMQLPLKVANPLTPTEFNVPVFVAPYVISDYGHGSVMGCPGHDARDNAFWKENMPDQPIVTVITPPEGQSTHELYVGKNGKLNARCGKFSGMSSAEGGKAVVDEIAQAGLGEHTTQYKLRDWLISRQRFWGAPIPMVHCGSCGIVPVPDEQLPVELPENLSSPLAHNDEFLKTTCPSCHGPAKRDSDTMDTFMDSSWYFFRYTDAQNNNEIFNPAAASALMPVDIYLGGVEHAILHLLYSRFVSKYLQSCGAWSGGDLNGEPFRRLVTQGMVHGKTFTDPDNGRFLKTNEVDLSNPESPRIIADGRRANVSFEKMSKSKYNGADPGACIAKHGADATRAHILFQAPVTEVLNWDESKIVGIERWLSRVLSVTAEVGKRCEGQGPPPVEYSRLTGNDEKFWDEVQAKTKSMTESLHTSLSLNTLISDYMKLTRTIQTALDEPTDSANRVSFNCIYYATEALLKMMAPVAPATGEECWEMIQEARGDSWSSVFAESWPQAESKPASTSIKYGVIINGKRRVELDVEEGTSSDEIINLAKSRGKQWIGDKQIKRIVLPKGKPLVSIITERN